MNNDSKTLTLYPSKKSLFLNLFISVIFVLGGIYMIQAGEPPILLWWVDVILFGLGFIILCIQLLPGSSYLKLSSEGFETKNLFKSHLTKWSDVEKFGHQKIGSKDMVVLMYVESYKGAEKTRKFSNALTGIDGALPDSYGMDIEDLADLLTEWKRRHSVLEEDEGELIEFLLRQENDQEFDLLCTDYEKVLRPRSMKTTWEQSKFELTTPQEVISFSPEPPGLQVSFGDDAEFEDYSGTEERAIKIAKEILENIEKHTGQKGKMIQI